MLSSLRNSIAADAIALAGRKMTERPSDIFMHAMKAYDILLLVFLPHCRVAVRARSVKRAYGSERSDPKAH